MGSRLYIGTRNSGALIELPDRPFNALLDFAYEQGEIDGIDYLERLKPFRSPIRGPFFEGDTFDEWAVAKGYDKNEILASLQLWLDLLERHGKRWEEDSDWGMVGWTAAELREMFKDAARIMTEYEGQELLFSWAG